MTKSLNFFARKCVCVSYGGGGATDNYTSQNQYVHS